MIQQYRLFAGELCLIKEPADYDNTNLCKYSDVEKLESEHSIMLQHLKGMKIRFIVHGQGNIDFEIELLKALIEKVEGK